MYIRSIHICTLLCTLLSCYPDVSEWQPSSFFLLCFSSPTRNKNDMINRKQEQKQKQKEGHLQKRVQSINKSIMPPLILLQDLSRLLFLHSCYPTRSCHPGTRHSAFFQLEGIRRLGVCGWLCNWHTCTSFGNTVAIAAGATAIATIRSSDVLVVLN